MKDTVETDQAIADAALCPTTSTLYSGDLEYDTGSDVIIVRSMIVHADKVAFDLTTTWQDLGRWRVNDVANRTEDGEFVTGVLFSRHETTGQPDAKGCQLKFRIVRLSSDEIELRGMWCQFGANQFYPFSGILERV